jgi:phage tail sheath protein FI
MDKVQMTGGDSGTAPTSYDVINAWNQFSNKQLYGVNLLINGGFSEVNVQKAMIALAEKRGDCVALLDVPSANQRWQSAIDYRNLSLNANTTYASLFCPDVYESDSINGKDLFVPFSGWAAALCAYTDSIADPSVSPAGLNRGILTDVLATRYTYDDSQASNLYKAQVNYTRTFVGAGIALWEQLTLQSKQSALSWLCVRRIINVIKVSLYNGLVPYLQERNDDFTARAIKAVCDEYLGQLKAARAISDFTVSTKTSTAEINSGVRRVTVVIIPMIPIHEIQLNVVISKQGATFEEVLSQVGG